MIAKKFCNDWALGTVEPPISLDLDRLKSVHAAARAHFERQQNSNDSSHR